MQKYIWLNAYVLQMMGSKCIEVRIESQSSNTLSNHHNFEPHLYDQSFPHVSVSGLKFLLVVDNPVHDRLLNIFYFSALDE